MPRSGRPAAGSSGSSERTGRWRLAWPVVALVIVVGAVAAAGARRAMDRGGPVASKPTCTVRDGKASYRRPADQVALASDLAAVGVRLGLPDHAITVALATAMQESGLRNLRGGDRDSVGLLQQRPSQGWGKPAQLLDPAYAADAFYRRLLQVPGWERLDVTAAAQAVQRSARPKAYAAWEPEARAFAKAFTGQSGAQLACQSTRTTSGPRTRRAGSAAASAVGGPEPGTVVTAKQGWVAATWLVAHADGLGVTAVSFAGRRWTASGGNWKVDGPTRSAVAVEPTGPRAG
ncbi:MAG: hypothetical protein ABIY58_05665 [Acidimicrobiales bacterium]